MQFQVISNAQIVSIDFTEQTFVGNGQTLFFFYTFHTTITHLTSESSMHFCQINSTFVFKDLQQDKKSTGLKKKIHWQDVIVGRNILVSAAVRAVCARTSFTTAPPVF